MSTYLSSTKRRKEDDTPPTPYVKGIQMAGRRHVPLPSAHWEPRRATKAEIAEDEALTPLQRCVLHPASGGETIDTKTIDLTITAEVNVGNSHGAQVVIVNREKIIKIYDPLYYPRPSNFGSGCPDPHRSASTQYRSEVEVFLSLRCLWGTIVPEYHGSWTCDVPLPSGKTREVRFIMMELIPGICMKNLNDIVGKSLPLHERQAVMNKVIDAESSIRACGIFHKNMHPRNVMISSEYHDKWQIMATQKDTQSAIHAWEVLHDDLNPNPRNVDKLRVRVVIIDFADSYERRGGRNSDGFPISPIIRWHEGHRKHDYFGSWIDWDWQPWVEKTWQDSPGYVVVTEKMRRRCLTIM